MCGVQAGFGEADPASTGKISRMGASLRDRRIGGRLVRYMDIGDSSAERVLVLIHAFPMGTAMWAPQLEAFPGWRVIAPALPGFDGSDWAVMPGPLRPSTEGRGASSDVDGRGTKPAYAIDAYADHVVAILDDLGIERPVIGGLSMGGYVIFGLLRRAPDRASALILADTRPSADSGDRLAARRRTLDIVATAGARGVADDMVPKLLSPRTHAGQPAVVAEVRRLIESQPAATIAEATRAMMTRPESTALLVSVRVPTLIIVGAEDVITTPADAEGMRQAIPASQVVVIPGAGHMSNLEAPAAFNAAVRAFLSQLR